MGQDRHRFWKTVTLEIIEEGRYGLLLDTRPLRLPKGTVLSVTSKNLAQALVKEWQDIPDDKPFKPDDLPLTRMVGTAIERISPDLDATRDTLLAFGLDDALCYCTPAQDRELVKRVLLWAQEVHHLKPDMTTGIMPLEHSKTYSKGIAALLSSLDVDTLAALGVIVPVFSSLLLALAIIENILTIEEAVLLGQADEKDQIKRWGYDSELYQQLKKREQDVRDAMHFLSLV